MSKICSAPISRSATSGAAIQRQYTLGVVGPESWRQKSVSALHIPNEQSHYIASDTPSHSAWSKSGVLDVNPKIPRGVSRDSTLKVIRTP